MDACKLDLLQADFVVIHIGKCTTEMFYLFSFYTKAKQLSQVLPSTSQKVNVCDCIRALRKGISQQFESNIIAKESTC